LKRKFDSKIKNNHATNNVVVERMKPSEKNKLIDNSTTAATTTSKGVVNDNSNNKAWSKSKKKRMRRILAAASKQQQPQQQQQEQPSSNTQNIIMDDNDSNNRTETSSTSPSSSIQNAFKARLAGSRFRILNEELYTTTSQESYKRFANNPSLFEQYHDGFRHQVSSWPENPVNVIVRSLTSSAWYSSNSNKNNKNYGDKSDSTIVVADFGCGDAQLAKDLLKANDDICKPHKGNNNIKKSLPLFTVHSFDLVAPNELVTACDMANVPLPDKSVDICVFCLSLMGTNLADFIREAHRVLKEDGHVKIAEVRSRIEYSHKSSSSSRNDKKKTGKGASNVGRDNPAFMKSKADEKTEGTLEEFLDVLEKLGFQCTSTDRSNTMFLLLELKKNGKEPDRNLKFTAKPCIYKRR
jgi:ribosomal RNA-processing protein 8